MKGRWWARAYVWRTIESTPLGAVRDSLVKQLDPRGSNRFSRESVPVFLRKPIASCDFSGRSGPPVPLPLCIRIWWSAFFVSSQLVNLIWLVGYLWWCIKWFWRSLCGLGGLCVATIAEGEDLVSEIYLTSQHPLHLSSLFLIWCWFIVVASSMGVVVFVSPDFAIYFGWSEERWLFLLWLYSKICVKRPLSERQTIGFQDKLSLNAGQMYYRMLQGEHSVILLTFIKLPLVIKIFVLSIFERPFNTGFTTVFLGLICAFLSLFLESEIVALPSHTRSCFESCLLKCYV